MTDKEFQKLEIFEEQLLKIAIAEGIKDLKNNKIHDFIIVFNSLRNEIKEYDN